MSGDGPGRSVGRPKRRVRRQGTGTVTVREVASAARVSMATVSRALNGHAGVAPVLRERVVSAAARLGYTPHAAARALASRRSRIIGAVIPSLESPNFAVGVAALQRRLAPAGYTLLLASSGYDPEEELRQVKALVAHGIAGLMLVGGRHVPALGELLEAKGVPAIHAWVLDPRQPCVGFDNRGLGQVIAGHLLGLGHRRIGIIAQRGDSSDRAALRIGGIREAVAAAGAPPPLEQLVVTPHDIGEGGRALNRLLTPSPRVTAVICGTDALAFGALVEAGRLGIAVPQALSITGINDVDYAAHLVPPLTTVRLPADEIGARAADYLLGRLAGQPVAAVNPVRFDLVVRGSTAPPARAAGSGAEPNRLARAR